MVGVHKHFDPPHEPIVLAANHKGGVRYLYRGFEFEVEPLHAPPWAPWQRRYCCFSYSFIGTATEMRAGLLWKGKSLDALLRKMRDKLDAAIDNDIARQELGSDSHFETFEEFISRRK